MKSIIRTSAIWAVLLLLLLLVGTAVALETPNPISPALDRLAAIDFNERWSQPEMVTIRALGAKGVADLRRTFTDIESRRTRALLWLKTKWPGAPKYIPNYPDPRKLVERRLTACQVLSILGPAGKAAAPELIKMFKNDGSSVFAAAMALQEVGIDAGICERLAELVEEGISPFGQEEAIYMFLHPKSPSPKVVKVLASSLTHSSAGVQGAAAYTIGYLKVSSPEILSHLRTLQTSDEKKCAIEASSALWNLETNKDKILLPLFKLLNDELLNYRHPKPGSPASGLGPSESLFVAADDLFTKMPLSAEERIQALHLLESCCEKSGRIYLRLSLLRSMLQLGFPAEKGIEICRAGLKSNENFHRLIAAQSLAEIAEKYPGEDVDFEELLHDSYVGVRVNAAKGVWLKTRNATELAPVLVDALDRAKYQEQSYPDIQSTALEVLALIGPEAKSAAKAVESLRNDPDPKVANLACETLKQLKF